MHAYFFDKKSTLQLHALIRYLHVYSKTIKSAELHHQKWLNREESASSTFLDNPNSISRNRPTHFYLLIFRIFHPTILIWCYTAIRYCRVEDPVFKNNIFQTIVMITNKSRIGLRMRPLRDKKTSTWERHRDL